jgi:alpha-1,2-mannosyltransferase
VSGNLPTQGDVVSAPRQSGGHGASPQASGVRARLDGSPFGAGRLRAYWLSAPGRVMLLATALAIAIRLFTLTRPGYLTGITEYDDGVYLGGALRMVEGAMPYKDFALVQPPGILVLMTPVAVIAKLTTTVKALALARLLTALASAACVPLAGNLVRYRGTVVTLVTCGVLAIYPSDITTAHTLMLEPWMNLFCLLAMNAAFRRGHLARPGQLVWAGLALGFAGTIKFWAVAPAAVLLGLCLVVRQDRIRRVRAYLLGLAAGFVIPVAPFLAAAPMAFLHSTITDQAARIGSGVSIGIRLANLTGLIDIFNNKGKISLNAGAHSMYAAGTSANLGTASSLGWLPIVATVALVAVIAVGYSWQSRRLTQLEWLSLITTVLAAAAILGYSAFFYHYPDFVAPWLALTLGGAAGVLAGRPAWRTIVIYAVTVAIVLVAALQIRETFPLRQPNAQAMAHQIPKSACVVTDEVSLTIAADRFANLPPGCPDIIDALASTLVLSNGVSVQGGANRMPQVVAAWKAWLGKADYVWLSPGGGSKKRIPWTHELSVWFNGTFAKLGSYSPGTGQLWVRITDCPGGVVNLNPATGSIAQCRST